MIKYPSWLPYLAIILIIIHTTTSPSYRLLRGLMILASLYYLYTTYYNKSPLSKLKIKNQRYSKPFIESSNLYKKRPHLLTSFSKILNKFNYWYKMTRKSIYHKPEKCHLYLDNTKLYYQELINQSEEIILMNTNKQKDQEIFREIKLDLKQDLEFLEKQIIESKNCQSINHNANLKMVGPNNIQDSLSQ